MPFWTRSRPTFPAVPYTGGPWLKALIEHAWYLKQTAETADAERAFRRAIDLYEKLAADFPTVPSYWQSAFDQRLNLGRSLKETGRIAEANQMYRDAVPIVSSLPTDDPGRLAHWVALARTHGELSRMLSAAGKSEDAEAAFRQVVAVSEKLEAEMGGLREFRRDLCSVDHGAGGQLEAAGRAADAERLYLWRSGTTAASPTSLRTGGRPGRTLPSSIAISADTTTGTCVGSPTPRNRTKRPSIFMNRWRHGSRKLSSIGEGGQLSHVVGDSRTVGGPA